MKAWEESVATDTIELDDLHLMLIVAGGMSWGHLYGASLESSHLRAESSGAPFCRGLALIRPLCADTE